MVQEVRSKVEFWWSDHESQNQGRHLKRRLRFDHSRIAGRKYLWNHPPLGRDDRQSVCHRFEEDQAEALGRVVGRKTETVAFEQQLLFLTAAHESMISHKRPAAGGRPHAVRSGTRFRNEHIDLPDALLEFLPFLRVPEGAGDFEAYAQSGASPHQFALSEGDRLDRIEESL